MDNLGFSESSAGVIDAAAAEGIGVRLVGCEEGDAQLLKASGALDEAARLAAIPGVVSPIVVFPNLEGREGFPSGVVLATGGRDGAVIPEGVGPDVNCGLRLLGSNLRGHQVAPVLDRVLAEIERYVHVGEEASGPLSLSSSDLDEVLDEGCRYLVGEKRIGKKADLDALENEGHFREANAGALSARAKSLGAHQLGTLGRGGSHFVELDVVEKIFDGEAARRLRLFDGQLVVQIHAGARELGRQVHADAVTLAREARARYRLRWHDDRLAWLPLSGLEGERCYQALLAAANFGLANRHVIADGVRRAFEVTLADGLDRSLKMVLDADSNTVRVERVDGELCCVHRRGAASAYPPGHPAVPPIYRDLGQPVILPGSMGAPSFVMRAAGPIGELARSSAPHGAGRAMSRREAHRRFGGGEVRAAVEGAGTRLSMPTNRRVAEEAPGAYRDAAASALALQRAGILQAVAQLRPVAVTKA